MNSHAALLSNELVASAVVCTHIIANDYFKVCEIFFELGIGASLHTVESGM